MIATFLLLLFITGAGADNGGSTPTAAQFLGPQNVARAALRLPPLTWSNKLQQYAEAYANRRKGDCALIHSPENTYGENIFWGSGTDWSPAQAVELWLSEKQYYNYFSNSCEQGQECGHYTQIVWRNTKQVGCARVVCNGGKGVFMTCNYDPPGNYIGEKPY
ncbi:pathogenesis-related protein PR-1-like [Impatiens glandulifera]|uniref:pathogenesis-related protein PR-1-like n=1 Tax=Impatiens glandulifera TaxID=253017 RepID=UPI001FB11FEF|nr:pathogenesis-related protein PR-1-like [Impatiens glandulifera]